MYGRNAGFLGYPSKEPPAQGKWRCLVKLVYGPNLLFVELCRFRERDDEPCAIVSDPLPVLVNIR